MSAKFKELIQSLKVMLFYTHNKLSLVLCLILFLLIKLNDSMELFVDLYIILTFLISVIVGVNSILNIILFNKNVFVTTDDYVMNNVVLLGGSILLWLFLPFIYFDTADESIETKNMKKIKAAIYFVSKRENKKVVIQESHDLGYLEAKGYITGLNKTYLKFKEFPYRSDQYGNVWHKYFGVYDKLGFHGRCQGEAPRKCLKYEDVFKAIEYKDGTKTKH